jgi:spore coat protein U-like protein
MVADDKNSGFPNSPTFLLEKLNQIYADDKRTRKFDAETKTQTNKQQPASLNQPMKNTTLRGLFAAALVLVSSSAFAQSTANASASASARVIEPVTVTKADTLNFGNVAPSITKVIGVDGTVLVGTVSGGEMSAKFDITKGQNVPLFLGLSLPSALVDGSNSLPISFSDEASTKLGDFTNFDAANCSTAEVITPATSSTWFDVQGTPQACAYRSKEFQVRIGGRVSPASSQAAGLYSGTITLTATYN